MEMCDAISRIYDAITGESIAVRSTQGKIVGAAYSDTGLTIRQVQTKSITGSEACICNNAITVTMATDGVPFSFSEWGLVNFGPSYVRGVPGTFLWFLRTGQFSSDNPMPAFELNGQKLPNKPIPFMYHDTSSEQIKVAIGRVHSSGRYVYLTDIVTLKAGDVLKIYSASSQEYLGAFPVHDIFAYPLSPYDRELPSCYSIAYDNVASITVYPPKWGKVDTYNMLAPSHTAETVQVDGSTGKIKIQASSAPTLTIVGGYFNFGPEIG